MNRTNKVEPCKQCGKRPRFGTFDYCGRVCADEARKSSSGISLSSLGALSRNPSDLSDRPSTLKATSAIGPGNPKRSYSTPVNQSDQDEREDDLQRSIERCQAFLDNDSRSSGHSEYMDLDEELEEEEGTLVPAQPGIGNPFGPAKEYSNNPYGFQEMPSGGIFPPFKGGFVGSSRNDGGPVTSNYAEQSRKVNAGSNISVSGVERVETEVCEECHMRPKHQAFDQFTRRSVTYPHCSRTCRDKAARRDTNDCVICNPEASVGYCSDQHARKAVAQGKQVKCACCKVWPAIPYCDRGCGPWSTAGSGRTMATASKNLASSAMPRPCLS